MELNAGDSKHPAQDGFRNPSLQTRHHNCSVADRSLRVTSSPTFNALDQLAEGIASLTSSDRWREWLTVQSRFHDYSFGNCLLILLQRPDASRVAGFRTWQGLGRCVRRGETGIRILAPMICRVDETEGCDRASARTVRGFHTVSVFDISQTDGDELPEVCIRLNGRDGNDTFTLLTSVADVIGFRVVLTTLSNGTNGVCDHNERILHIESRNDDCQQAKTLAHELAHAVLHGPDQRESLSRPVKELEAESVAFVVCQCLGIDASDYSFGYVATWVGGNEEAQKAIRFSASRIQRSAKTILDAIDASSDSTLARNPFDSAPAF